MDSRTIIYESQRQGDGPSIQPLPNGGGMVVEGNRATDQIAVHANIMEEAGWVVHQVVPIHQDQIIVVYHHG